MTSLSPKLMKLKKLNFGSGNDKRLGYLNVDIDEKVNPDLVITDNDYSVIPKNHYNEILANDILEHIERQRAFSVLLDWVSYLRKDGKLFMQSTSIINIAKNLSEQRTFKGQQLWLHMLFGTQAQLGDYHFNSFTRTTLSVFLTAVGFRVDTIGLRDTWLFEVEATKVSDWNADLDKFIANHKKNHVLTQL